MIDHVLGRPSLQFRKIQVLSVVLFWTAYLVKGDRHGPPSLRKLSRSLQRVLTPWQTLVITLLYLYIARNLGKLVGLECPEPLANLYTRSYFRATWVTTALDAGFWTAMKIRKKWVRDLASVIFTGYYLIAAEQADEKVRKVRGCLTVDHLRVSWNKGTTPYLAFLSRLLRPKLMRYPPRAIRIPRPSSSDYREPVSGWLYYNGPLTALKDCKHLVLDIPGGGFVAMDPRTNDDKLFGWAGKTGRPILSLDYRKAPEFPYPYALNECYDVYRTIVASRGRCIGLSGETIPKIIITGDSAGGNLATSLTLMIIEAGSSLTRQRQGDMPLPVPDGLILIYPGLDMNIANWMSDEQMSLIKDRRMRQTNKNLIRRKSMQYNHLTGTPHASDDEGGPEGDGGSTYFNKPSDSIVEVQRPSSSQAIVELPPSHRPQPMQTRLAMSSMISYFNDRILTPEMMRAMIILYIGPHNRPDFSRDYLLSPILAPDALLQHFPKTYFLTGERDPLVDDTAIFAGRLRRAKAEKYRQDQEDNTRLRREFDEREVVEVALIPGISHGFLQFAGVYPEGWKLIYKCARWIREGFAEADARDSAPSAMPTGNDHISNLSSPTFFRNHVRHRTESSVDEDAPLEIAMPRNKGKGKASQLDILREKQDAARRQREQLLRDHLNDRKASSISKRRSSKGSIKEKRQKSSVTLASEEDLLGRRMLGLAGPLTGVVDESEL